MLGNPAELPLFFNATDWLLGTVGTRDQMRIFLTELERVWKG